MYMEAKVLKKFYCQIVGLIQDNQDSLTLELYAKGLISKDLKDRLTTTCLGVPAYQKTLDLVKAVEDKVLFYPRNFYRFLSLLRSRPELSDVVEQIEEELGECMCAVHAWITGRLLTSLVRFILAGYEKLKPENKLF